MIIGSALFNRDILRPELAAAVSSFSKPRNRATTADPVQEALPDLDSSDEKVYLLYLNVIQFKPEEVKVRLVEDELVVHCKHDLRMDQHGYASREFKRRFKLPDDVNKLDVKCIFSQNGLLTIKVPKNVVEEEELDGIVIPVQVQTPIGMGAESRPLTIHQLDETRSPTKTEYIVTHATPK